MIRRTVLLVLALSGCSAAPSTGDDAATQGSPLGDCEAVPDACTRALDPSAFEHAAWATLRCPADVTPTYAPVLVPESATEPAEKLTCTGWWNDVYSPTSTWTWCCPTAR